MRFQKGMSKPKGSGIKLGQKQKAPFRKKRIHELLWETSTCPVEEIVKLLPELTPKERVDVYLSLLPFCFPKLSAQAVQIEDLRETEELAEDHLTDETEDTLIEIAKDACKI